MQTLKQQLERIDRQLNQALLFDQMAGRRELNQLRKALGRPRDRGESLQARCDRLTRRMRHSIRICRERRAQRLQMVYDDRLPIMAKREEIIDNLSRHQVMIIAGETGSGKTTQLPKFCLQAGRGIQGCIGVTQPRRIAATSVGLRIAEEMGESIGQTVAYKVRFKDTTGPATRIKIMTDGILLTEAHRDRNLYQYDTLIVDEAHERSLNIDFTLGLLSRLVQKRKNLKLIITSATIDTQKFSRAFDNAPVVEVSGKLYPVQTRYFTGEPEKEEEASHIELAVQALDQLRAEKRFGDVLIFMPTEQDIRDTCELLRGRHYPTAQIIPLFARLSANEQQKVFHSGNGQRIIVATNVAETSITIPGIRYVIDTGLARILQYTPRSRTTTLPVLPVSQSSADQRKGRCGRVADGICIRLYCEEDYNNRPRYSQPEILRCNLAEVILRMIALGLGDVEAFPFIDAPAARSIRDGYTLLEELGAICPAKTAKPGQGRYALTPKGRLMAQLPLDPRLSCMLLEARDRGCLEDIIILAAALSIQDPRERPVEKQAGADQAQACFVDPSSDFVSLLRIWHAFQSAVRSRTRWAQVKAFCCDHFLSMRRMREWQDIHRQICLVLSEHSIRAAKASAAPDEPSDPRSSWYAALHQSILSGFLSNIAQKKEKQLFQASHNRQVMIFPGSGLFKNPGQWIVAAEMVETSRLFARCAAVILPDWLEDIGGEQCTYTYGDPRWERRRGQVTATEQVSLYGLIIDRRPRPFGPVDPESATEIFIRHALIQGDVRRPLPFMQHNAELINSVQDMENRLRRRDLLIEEQALLDFYQQRLGIVYDMRGLEKKIRDAGGDRFLRMDQEQIIRWRLPEDALHPFPDSITVNHVTVSCDYQFLPGSEEDGVTASIPALHAGGIAPESLQWLVPGLLPEKLYALLKALAKPYRKQLVPLNETAELIARQMPHRPRESLFTALSRFIQQRLGVTIPPSAWDESLLPDHLRLRIAITDDQGQVIKTSRDPLVVKQVVRQMAGPGGFQQVKEQYERNVRSWDFGDLPPSVSLKDEQGREWLAFPALTADNQTVTLTVFGDAGQAAKTHPQGVKALLMRELGPDIKYLAKNLKLPPTDLKPAAYFGGPQQLESQLLERVLDDLLARDIRNAEDFHQALQTLKAGGVAGQGQETRRCVLDILHIYHDARLLLANLEKTHPANAPGLQFLEVLRARLGQLVPANFIRLYGNQRLGDLVRYIKALMLRAERGIVNPEKDRGKAIRLESFSQTLQELISSLDDQTSREKRQAVEDLFWMLEEFQISLFAQEIKTAYPVSEKKLKAQIKKIENGF